MMEWDLWDCKRFQRNNRKQHTFSATISNIFILLCLAVCATGFYIDCDQIQQSGNCECVRLTGYSIDCPKHQTVYPIQLQVHSIGPTEAFLEVLCNSENGKSELHWEKVEGVDLSEDKIAGRIIKLTLNRCPADTQALRNLINRINITSEHILRFSHIESEDEHIPEDYFSDFTNLEVLNLNENKLIEKLPDLSKLPNLKELTARSSGIKELPSFKSNSKLRRIHLPYNKITAIPPNTFPESVESIDLSSKGKLKSLTNESFANLPNLKHLILQGASLKEAEPDVFNNLPQLQVLYLIEAQFRVFPSLRNLPMLANLTIDWIRLEHQPLEVKDLPNLTQIKAAASRISLLPIFKNMTNLKFIDLQRNTIPDLSRDFFSNLPALKELDLSSNKISDLVEIRSPHLERLNLRANNISTLPKNVFVHLLKLKELDISYNKISNVDYKAFDSQGELEILDLSNNEIIFESPFKNVPDEHSFGTFSAYSFLHNCLKLRQIKLSHNKLERILDDWKNLFLYVEELDLSYNKIGGLNAMDFHFLTQKNLKLNLSHNEITKINLMELWILQENDYSSVDVFLDGNPLVCDCLAYHVKRESLSNKSLKLHVDNLLCAVPANLQNKQLTEVNDKDFLCQLNSDHSPTKLCPCWNRPADSSFVVNCSNQHFENDDLPNLHWDSTIAWGQVGVVLDFSRNNISSVPSNYITELPTQVKLVDFSRNNLKNIAFMKDLSEKSNMNFSFAENPFLCDSCIDFTVIWATQTSRIVDSDNITCIERTHDFETVFNVQNLSELVDLCSNQIDATGLRILIICLVIFCTMCIIMIVFMLRYSWVIKAYIYSNGWGWCLFWDGDVDDDSEEKIYDAFVSFSHKDEDWVIDELVDRLEAQEGFKLCLHFRDWTAGDWIPDQIVRSVDQSKRTVVILSKNFVESVWSRLEFKAAHAQALSQRSNRVILVLLEDEMKEHDIQDDELKVYMKMNTYLKRSDPWFWHKLKYALPHRKTGVNKDLENQEAFKKRQQHEKAKELDRIRTKLEQVV